MGDKDYLGTNQFLHRILASAATAFMLAPFSLPIPLLWHLVTTVPGPLSWARATYMR